MITLPHHWLSRVTSLLAAATLVLGAGLAAAPSAYAAGAGDATPSSTASTTAVTISCVRVLDLDLPGRFTGWLRATSSGKTEKSDCDPADPKASPGTLVGSGDLLIAVDTASLDKVLADHAKQKGDLVLFLNGVPLLQDAKFQGGEKFGNKSLLRFRVSHGEHSQVLWSQLYVDPGLFEKSDLHIGLGWRDPNTNVLTALPVRGDFEHPMVAITTGGKFWIAAISIALLLGLMAYLGASTDVVRDAPTPTWWRDAARLRASLGRRSRDEKIKLLSIPGHVPLYAAAEEQTYVEKAERALDGKQMDSTDENAIVLGLVLRDRPPLRASFSLTKMQLALWFTFTVATGIFLWVLYGDLQKIDDSMLTLLGISVGSAGISWATDRSAGGRDYQQSEGFWHDIVTGFDEQMHVHRYQAVVVNLLLLLVGVVHVLQQLTYPVFDPSWLLFLGISGTAFGVGKQMKENKQS